MMVLTMVSHPEPATEDPLFKPAVIAAGGFALFGFLVAAVSTNLTLAAGERAMTVLPITMGGESIPAIVGFRAVLVITVAATIKRWFAGRLGLFLTATGLFWIVVAILQAWVMLART